MNKNMVICNNELMEPEKNHIEIVERKGVGHPDTLADALAEECSRVYSLYCIEHFGTVLHHNIDKLYIGGGCFRGLFGEQNRIAPILIRINGRISNRFGDELIDLEKIFVKTIKTYIGRVLPHIDVNEDIVVDINCTQNTRNHNWFTPEDIQDIPDSQSIYANDTSTVTAFAPFSTCEQLAFELEHFFWNYDEMFYPVPKFYEFGQDIKVMVTRVDQDIQIQCCVPVISTEIANMDEYYQKVDYIERLLQSQAEEICRKSDSNYTVHVHVNEHLDENGLPTKHVYMLIKGTCAECGEEGIVGRGNASNGIIPSFRPHSMEAPAGKNPQYHTGRVLGYLSNYIAQEINKKYLTKVQVIMQTINRGSLIPPYLTVISTDYNKKDDILSTVNAIMDKFDYRRLILERRNLR